MNKKAGGFLQVFTPQPPNAQMASEIVEALEK